MKNLWLIGTGQMAIEYAKLLNDLGVNFTTIGRGIKNAESFKLTTGCDVIVGGLEKHLESKPLLPDGVIVAVGVQELSEITVKLIKFGVKKILLEKPGICEANEINRLVDLAVSENSKVLLAYNRRFYSSVIAAEEIIKKDGEVTSFNFEFTEWSHEIEKLDKPKIVFENWMLANSTHVIDTAFFLGGKPTRMNCFTAGSLKWHPSTSRFTGAGITDRNALFSYQANWAAPGRWAVEILTSKHRLVFRPMESLQIQKIGSVSIESVVIDDSLDKKYKPGLYLQTQAFLANNFERFCTIFEQKEMIEKYYLPMAGYTHDQ